MACIKTSTASWLTSDDLAKSYSFQFDLQLFNGEKTEEATPKRKDEARKKGQVAKSVEINSAFIILAAFFSLKLFGPYMYEQLANYMQFIFSQSVKGDLTLPTVQVVFIDFALVFLKVALPIMGVILIISLVANFLQVGFNFTFEPLMPNFDRINPLSGLQRLFSKRVLVELGKSVFKITVISYFIYRFIIQETMQVPKLMAMDLRDSMKMTASLIVDLALQIGLVILVLAIIDYFYQWWEHNQSLKMSKQEVKEEFKQAEGNPQIKGKIKERQRAMAMQRMMQEIPKANVVVTNPTHFAIALKYEKDMAAPVVIAKGQDFLAQRIKEIAKEHDVAIVENKPLARALYSTTEVGDIIPSDLYQAVAEVLAHVYRLKKRLS